MLTLTQRIEACDAAYREFRMRLDVFKAIGEGVGRKRPGTDPAVMRAFEALRGAKRAAFLALDELPPGERGWREGAFMEALAMEAYEAPADDAPPPPFVGAGAACDYANHDERGAT